MAIKTGAFILTCNTDSVAMVMRLSCSSAAIKNNAFGHIFPRPPQKAKFIKVAMSIRAKMCTRGWCFSSSNNFT